MCVCVFVCVCVCIIYLCECGDEGRGTTKIIILLLLLVVLNIYSIHNIIYNEFMVHTSCILWVVNVTIIDTPNHSQGGIHNCLIPGIPKLHCVTCDNSTVCVE